MIFGLGMPRGVLSWRHSRQESTEETSMKLSGIRVLDLSRFLPGPYLTMLMADHGAEVIKIESHQGEPTRQLGPPVAGHSVYFRVVY
jgi:crotonobetainyl-CoA:carnitine CoA-transferase CaiB-like acyl-CoA transferase